MIIDSEELLEELEDDRELLAQMFQIFEQDAGGRMSRIRDAIASGNSAVLMEEAHALKGGVGNFFAMSVFDTAYKLEIMGRDNELAEASSVFATLETQVDAMKAEIRQIIAG
jgi:HPt (histidine-containing phosphotransfer) domain-containing protein